MIHSVFGASPPPGTLTLFTNNPPSITPGGRFYRYGGLLPTASIVGGRVYLPTPAPGSTGVRIMLWLTGTMATAPDREVTVPITGSTSGWVEGIFAAPAAMPGDGENVRIGYQFVGNPATYIYSPDFRPDAVDQFVSPQGNGLAYSELRSIFRDGTGPESDPGSYAVYYGVDILVDDGAGPPPDPTNVVPTVNAGANRSIYLGQSTTLTATAADSDGTVASIEWFQTSGPPVALGGAGAVRTFTPAVIGTYVFAATATDDDGANSVPDPVTVTVLAVPAEPDPEPEPEGPSATIKPFGMIEKALRQLINVKAETPLDHIGGDLSYDASTDDYYVWIGLVTGQSTEIDGRWIVDIDVFDNRYTQAMERALALEAILLTRGGHRTALMRLDNVTQNEVPVERPWDDDNAYRIGATYEFTARRSG